MINNKYVIGIIAEYDPFHNGHKYLIDYAKKITGAEYTCIIMSGPFMQRGSLSMFSPHDRAHMAIQNGADIVFEIPTCFALSDANRFAFGGVSILNDLDYIDYIAFACEDKDIDIFNNILDVISDENLHKYTSNYLSQGISYAQAKGLVINELLGAKAYHVFSKSNNILAIAYLQALKKLNSKISPVLIKRNSSHIANELNFDSPSASSIRDNLIKGNLHGALKCIPFDSKNYIKELILQDKLNRNEFINSGTMMSILNLSDTDLQNIAGFSEGLDNKIIKEFNHSSNIYELISNIKSRRYTLSRIKRGISYSVLGISQNELEEDAYPKYTKLLAYNSCGQHLLSKTSKIKIIKKPSDITEQEYIIDKKAYNIWKISAKISNYKIFEIKRL